MAIYSGSLKYYGESDNTVTGNDATHGAYWYPADEGEMDQNWIITGNAAADTMSGGNLADIISGENGADVLYGGAGDDIIYGNSGNDKLFGDAGNDRLYGGAGNDIYTIKINEGSDTIYGSAGETAGDTIVISGAKIEDLSVDASGNDVQISFEETTGYEGGLTIVNGVVGADGEINKLVTDDGTIGLFVGNDANNTLTGSTISDYIIGGTGNDTINGLAGKDYIEAGAGNDLIYFDANDTVDGGAGFDVITLESQTAGVLVNLGEEKYTDVEGVLGSSLADSLAGGSLDNVLDGKAGNDLLWGGAGAYDDRLIGGVGADTFWFGSGEGNDMVAFDGVNSKNDVVNFYNSALADLSFSVSGNDVLITVEAESGATNQLQIVDGVSNVDDHVVKYVTTDQTFNLYMANSLGDTIQGSTGVDLIYGSDVADTIVGGNGADSIVAGNGADLITYDSADVVIDGGEGNDALKLTAASYIDLSDSKFSSIEIINGSAGADSLAGTDDGAETLIGGAGDDIFLGAGGNDYITGGLGSDTYWFGAEDGTDIISDGGTANAGDVVNFYNLSINALSFTAVNNDLQISVNADAGYDDKLVLENWLTNDNTKRINKFVATEGTFGLAVGNDISNNLKGTTIADYILAGDGADTINGLAGADSIYAGAGDDIITYSAEAAVIDGGEGIDTLSAAGASTGKLINLGLDNITDVEFALGSAYADSLAGGTGNETLSGGIASDMLWGAAGNDVLIGGAGVDTYWFGAGDGADTIAEATDNNKDYVYFYNIGSEFTTTLDGNDLVINYGGGDTLTIQNWNSDGGQQLNKFSAVGVDGYYKLTMTDSTTGSWTKI